MAPSLIHTTTTDSYNSEGTLSNCRDGVIPSPSAFDTGSTIPLWLNGEQVELSETFDVISPQNQKVLYKCSSASETDVERAVASAQEAFKAWSQTKPNFRRDIFLRAADIFEKRMQELGHYSQTETGALPSMFSLEHGLAADACRSVAGLIQIATASSVLNPAEHGSNAITVKQPYGVVLAISPWNVPNVLALRACLQPLAMGNTVVHKGPELAPATHWGVVSVLHEAGLPAGCLNTIYHRPADAGKITSALIAHPAIKKINFTGSTSVGAIIASQAGKYLKPTVMELGGKAPSIVCEDANIPYAAQQCALGALLHAGQICMSTERIIVHVRIADQFRAALKDTIDEIFTEKGIGAPRLVSLPAVNKTNALVADALSKGATALCGGPAANTANNDVVTDRAVDTKLAPTVLQDVAPGMDIYYTESFGPTVSLYVVDSDDEAIRLANDTQHGLSSAVFTEDLRRGLGIAKKIETGAVHINSMTVHDEPALPHGGVKASGWGRFNGLQGLEEWVFTQVVTWKDRDYYAGKNIASYMKW
ncbi:uncharacterized protein Z520_03355 [Fonsecaea multimorphosa CBS 102226]|uniref:Aldehyde dehydrogenase domain-containing protein n=1 Tax=Fonsecaea multimorphosa CBS 102226 TaxID=1442371 RepID=A0A0D2KC57_9EURO|nr:uncharacterized protein Z520_03355 [Fonsecaea multimorphosa CBS 102226]KIY00690.1 hypothetical protein Z520_03355 [Fonsecaea multimorphosa CBS 102226]OAL27970.1 hypothetical protein AYO22_03185 [Fonsecaea multimorphosa]